jgi:4-alpha-glucanotransferase
MSLTLDRHAGLLVPLFSLPSSRSWGIGEIADIPLMAAWLRDAHQDLLQLLPINEMAVGQRSPYSAMTAMAIDPVYISVQAMDDFAAMGGEAAMGPAFNRRLALARRLAAVDYDLVRGLKDEALRRSFERFRLDEWGRSSPRAEALRAWAREQAWWLDDYTLFRALHAREQERSWTEWPDTLRRRIPAAIEEARQELADEILYREWLQWIADEQWREAKARSRPVSLMGDLPFMVDGDSADVWAHAAMFRLDAAVGAPPDAFSETGQNWGLPVCRWDAMAERDFAWLRDRARRSAAIYDGYRIDHLVGFYRTYVFPNDGGPSFFTPPDEADQLALGETVLRIFADAGARIVAEDLGTIPDFVRASLVRLEIPGYKVLRWEREWKKKGQPYRPPAAYPPVSLATSGTHDTESMAAWWDGLSEEERSAVAEMPGLAQRLAAGRRRGHPLGADVAHAEGAEYSAALRDALLGLLFDSGSDFLLLPVQDVFGWRDRINVPASRGDHNWTWKLPWPVDALGREPEARERAGALRAWSDESGRWKRER